MKMTLLLMAVIYFFAPAAVGGGAIRILALVLIFKAAFALPGILAQLLGRTRHI